MNWSIADGIPVEKIDDFTCAIYLDVPPSKVVLLQAYFENYEGAGIVRTLDNRASLVCILSTPSTVGDCSEILYSVKEQIGWRAAEPSQEVRNELLEGHFKKGPHA